MTVSTPQQKTVATHITNPDDIGSAGSALNALLTAIAASLGIVDDWDEIDRAKVNLIAGQAGITAEAGNVAANTPRVTLAADDPAVVSLGVIDNWNNNNHANVYPHPEYTTTQILNAVSADNNPPTLGTDGFAFQADTKDCFVVVKANAAVTNVDINIYIYDVDLAEWYIHTSHLDIQDMTGDLWKFKVPDCRGFGTRIYAEVDNFADGGTGNGRINAFVVERTV